MEPRKDDKSLGELFSELSRDTAELVRKEVQLARTEMTARASKVGRHVRYRRAALDRWLDEREREAAARAR